MVNEMSVSKRDYLLPPAYLGMYGTLHRLALISAVLLLRNCGGALKTPHRIQKGVELVPYLLGTL